jgi:hypothetical protein
MSLLVWFSGLVSEKYSASCSVDIKKYLMQKGISSPGNFLSYLKLKAGTLHCGVFVL